ncbi:MAG: hypothetical protein Q9168_005247 [Polycauliona sp. 1 TL-2023]
MTASHIRPPFLQLMRQELYSSTPYTPAAPRSFSKANADRRSIYRTPRTCSSIPTYPSRHVQHIILPRPFSTSTPRAAAVVTANPKKDEEGNEMLIDITERAATRLHEIMTKDSNPALALRVTVESGGCHGFQYLMSLTNMTAISQDDDTVFEASDGSGAKVVMDEPSLELLKGSKVDFTMELIGSQFKIVGNPAASSSCGCGTSFDIKA